MNTLFRSALLAAIFVLPTAAFAQSVMQVDETQVEMVAYEAGGPESAAVQDHSSTLSDPVGSHSSTLSDAGFNPAADVGLNSIYVRH